MSLCMYMNLYVESHMYSVSCENSVCLCEMHTQYDNRHRINLNSTDVYCNVKFPNCNCKLYDVRISRHNE